ncbi:MAG: hypothetical protein SGJ04_03715 [Bacteroidota bacterium]|nr:hypothetical protein [Bacteroidota bacterium]
MLDESPIVKLGAVNNLSDARWAAAAGINLLGFSFNPDNPSYVAPDKAAEIINWMTGPLLVGEFNGDIAELMLNMQERLNLDYIQLNDYKPNIWSSISEHCSIIQHVEVIDLAQLDKIVQDIANAKNAPELWIIACKDFTNVELDFRIKLQDIIEMSNVLLQVSDFKADAIKVQELYMPLGFHFIGGDEEQPGMKDFDELEIDMDIVEKIKSNKA